MRIVVQIDDGLAADARDQDGTELAARMLREIQHAVNLTNSDQESNLEITSFAWKEKPRVAE